MLTALRPLLTGTLVAAFLAAFITSLGWMITNRHTRQMTILRERLDLINRQLAEFYGPLYISCESSFAALKALEKKIDKGPNPLDDPNITEETLREYCHWMEHVFMPLNERREKVILEKSHLIRESYAPKCLLDFAAHVTTYRANMAKWNDENIPEPFAHIEYPKDLNEYASNGFIHLKKEQADLIGLIRKRGGAS